MRQIPFRRLLLQGAAMFSLSAGAQVANLDYAELSPPQPTSDPDRIVVTEFFSYQCPHCNAFEPVLRHWAGELPDDVAFERVPVSIGYPTWLPIARAFHALKAMGELETVDAAIFRAIHVDRERLLDKASIVEWVRQRGVDEDTFSDMYDSFGIDASVRRAEQRSLAHKVQSIPAVAVDGRYVVLIADDGTFEQQLDGLSELIDIVRRQKRTSD